MNRTTRVVVGLGAVAVFGLTGCGDAWPESEVEAALEEQLDAEFPEDVPHEVDCPEDMEAEEGERMMCEFTDSASAGSVDVEIVSVDGNDIEYEAEIASYGEDAEDTE